VISKYNSEEARNLKAYGELPDSAKLNEGGDAEDENDVEFNDEVDEDEVSGRGRVLHPTSHVQAPVL